MKWFFGDNNKSNNVVIPPSQKQDDNPESIIEYCNNMEVNILAQANHLPARAIVLALSIIDEEKNILTLGKNLPTNNLFIMRQMMNDYLPNLINSYILAKQSSRDSVDDRKIIEQLEVLNRSIKEIMNAVQHDNQSALNVQGTFLENKFGGFDLA